MGKEYYIASCVFTSQYPELSFRIQRYIRQRYGMDIVRCCTPRYKLEEFTQRMPPDRRLPWSALPDCAGLGAGDKVYSLCHNCSNIIEETSPQVGVYSLWELILADERFPYPDHRGLRVTVQDCWRSRDRLPEQQAVRALLGKMNVECIETQDNYGRTDFCGVSLYREQPARNPRLAPRHYAQNIEGKFLPHTPQEQQALMREYCRRFLTDTVVCYCHYCLEGLALGGVHGRHIAALLFD